MPDSITDVKPDSSTGGVNVESPPTDELAKTKADNERLKGALSSLQAERDDMRARLDRLDELEAKYGELSARQEAERRRLERGADTVEEQIEELRRMPQAKPWFTHLDRELAKATETSVNRAASMASVERAADFLEEMAEELAETEEHKEMSVEKLLKLIKPYMGQFEKNSPYLKTKKAVKAWKEADAYRKEKAAADKKRAEASLSKEDGGRQARESSAQEIINKNGSLSVEEKAALREKLGIVQRSK